MRFAALSHDLGKGTTPPEIWPSHRGHEERSVELLEGLCDRFRGGDGPLLVGLNGAQGTGKSTLLSILCGLLRPTRPEPASLVLSPCQKKRAAERPVSYRLVENDLDTASVCGPG